MGRKPQSGTKKNIILLSDRESGISMIYIVFNYSKFKYEIEELVKLFIPSSEYQFVDDEALVSNQSFLLKFTRSEGTDPFSMKGSFSYESNLIDSVDLKDMMYKKTRPVNDKDIKDCFKRGFYLLLSRHFGYYPPWGILTGVRPTKIVNELLDKTQTLNDIEDRLESYYFINQSKRELLINTVVNQRSILESSKKNEVGIYIGIPFCPTRCQYCSFTSYPANDETMKTYLKALFEEISYVGEMVQKSGLSLDSLYIGGGTPSVLSDEYLYELLSQVTNHFNILKEFTVECGRPDTITYEKLKVIKEAGAHRISINPQSMNLKTLEAIGRRHNPAQIIDAYMTARKVGIEAINMDVIAGLPGENDTDFEHTLKSIIGLNPENITVHTLALKRASRLKEISRQNQFEENTFIEKMMGLSQDLLFEAGYEPYYLYRQKHMTGNFENVGYSKKGFECIYNIKIMEEKQTIIALGAGGISKMYYPDENRLERVPNVSNYEIYIERIAEMLDRKRKLIFANIDNKNVNTL